MDRKTFLANLRRSHLISDPELRALKGQLPDTRRGRVVARTLVEWGLLTRFQAELLLAGRTEGFLLGQYRILDQLGQGGMGRVFKAVHQTMNRVVAIKVLAPHLMKTEKVCELFRREVRAAARLIHPNIVTAYDANQIGERHFLVMEFVDGPNLEQLVRRNGPLPVDLACELVRQAAMGLQHAFEMGMVHRDIKPANILLQTGGEHSDGLVVAKILDFGLARLQERGNEKPTTILGRDRVVMGTPDFLSPEQGRNMQDVDIRSDLYSLGCTYYYLLTGVVPFPGGNTLEKLVRHGTEAPVSLPAIRPDIPAAVAAIVERLLAKAPEDRYQTPADLAAALTPFAGQGRGDLGYSLPDASLPMLEIYDPEDSFTGLEGLAPAGSSSGAALAGTVGTVVSPTPVSEAVVSLPPRPAPGRAHGALKFALGVAVAMATGLGAALTWVLLTR
jgi:serine/threonine-protein kinase